MTNRIVIQGGYGAFHEIAARNYFPKNGLQIVPALTFETLIDTVADSELVEGGIMAIENSIAGSILRNYHLLNKSPLKINGEVFLRIRHQFMALPGTHLSQIREVHSHPVAIAQCHRFLKQYPHLQLKETEDTALSAKKIKEDQLKGVAAIASTAAAKLYDMEILSSCIEDNSQNFTRFLILNREQHTRFNLTPDKVSVSFCLSHEPGSLALILTQLAKDGANLTKIQSVPLVGKEWQYIFFVDFIQEEYNKILTTLEHLNKITLDLNILGIYKSGANYDS